MTVYKSKYSQIPGTSYADVVSMARSEYHTVQKRTPRRIPYVKSKYYTKDKVFINTFWDHLNQKSKADRVRRLKLYVCGLDLLRNSTATPEAVYKNTDKDHSFHRFYGQSKDGQLYCVQVKVNLRNNRKEFMSVFPILKQK